MMKYNTKLKKLQPSSMNIFQNEISLIDDITLLTYGESDIPPSKEIIFKAIDSLISYETTYQNYYGLESLRISIAKKENEHYKTYNKENVLICNGAQEGLFLVLSSLLNPNDEVLLISPTYPSYESIINYLEGKIQLVKCDENFEVDILDFKKKINAKIKLVIFNYPNNPTGSLLSNNKIKTIESLLLKYKTHFILDNVYDEIIYDNEAHSLFDNPKLHPYRIIINSLSKSQRLAGWRLGYLIADKNIIDLCANLHHEINVCLPKFMMKTMEYSLNQKSDIEYYKNNLTIIKKVFDKIKLKYTLPKGGIYICFNIEEFNMDSLNFCELLAKDFKLGLMPGTFFNLEGYVRMCFGVSKEKLLIGLNKLKKAIKILRK